MNVNPMIIPTVVIGYVLFRVGEAVHVRHPSRIAAAMSVIAGVLLAAPGILYTTYYLHFFDDAAWFYEFRSWRYTEVLGGGVGFIAGYLASALHFGPNAVRGRLILTVALLWMLIPYAKMIVLPVNLDAMDDEWSDGVCIQTSSASCGPSCVATLLKQEGLATTEREIAEESYTCRTGTENWYMARTLRRRGFSVDFAVDPPQPDTLRYPAIAGVKLGGRYGVGHFITVLDATPDEYVIGEPLDGRLTIPRDAVHRRYYFTGFFMVVGEA
jgi:hypothetical protein